MNIDQLKTGRAYLLFSLLNFKVFFLKRLKDISTPDFSNPSFNHPHLSIPNFSLPWFKNSWLKSLGLKSLWLKSLGLRCFSTMHLSERQCSLSLGHKKTLNLMIVGFITIL